MSDLDDHAVDDAFVLVRWLHELNEPTPNPAVIASLEDVAEDRGWHPYDALKALTAARGGIPGNWNPDMHPRGRDGKFIEKGGSVRLDGKIDLPNGKQFDATGLRGQVDAIIPDPKTPVRPTIRLRVTSPDGKRTGVVDVKPENVEAAPEKARLDGKPAPKPTDDYGRAPTGRSKPDNGMAGRPPAAKPVREPSDFGGMGGWKAPERKPETPEEKENRLAAEEVRGATDEELERQANLGPEVWQRAVAKEKANREARRAQDNARRQDLMDSINEDAAKLSTTDPEARAEGLDAILAKLRFSIIDTDKVHDHIYPPGESGRWTPERTAQHEAMWDDLLSQVPSAGVPQEHDALVLGGLPGAGKSYMLKPGQKADGFGVVSWEPGEPIPDGTTHVSINPDIVKEMLIERGMLPEGISPDLKPMEQVTFLHEESSYVAKMFSQRLGDLGYNVVLDNTMDSEAGMLKRMTPLARQGYKFRGIFADIPQEESLASAKKRYIDAALTPQGGRFVPSSVQGNRGSTKGTMSKNRDAMDTLVAEDWFTEYMIVDNTGVSTRNPKGEVVAQGTGTGSAADRYLPDHDAARPKAGPKMPTAPEAAQTIDVSAPIPAAPAV